MLDSVINAESARVDMGVAVLKKAQNADKQQGEAIVNLLESAGAPARMAAPQSSGLDVFA